MNKMPWFHFYPADWIKGTRELSNEEKGVWIDLLAFMWEGLERGKVVSDWPGIARMTGMEWGQAEAIILSLNRKGIMKVIEENAKVTLICRRMEREQNKRESARFRKSEFLERKRNEKVTRKKSEVRSQKSERDKDKDISSEPSKSDVSRAVSSPAVFIYPTTGRMKEWILTQDKLDEFRAFFPGIDALVECRTALAWCINNSNRRKTANGMIRFLNTWMSKAQNSFHKNGDSKEDEPWQNKIIRDIKAKEASKT